jgi:REP element-mobilizing transposase RayT
LYNYDYGSTGIYFITILIKSNKFSVAKIANNSDNYFTDLSESGKIIERTWKFIPEQFGKVSIDTCVIMPDHFHGIIKIMSPSKIISDTSGGVTGIKNPMLHEHSLGKVVRWFKAKSSFEIRNSFDPNFSWQRNYYDSILWNDRSLFATRKYIMQNPAKWEQK